MFFRKKFTEQNAKINKELEDLRATLKKLENKLDEKTCEIDVIMTLLNLPDYRLMNTTSYIRPILEKDGYVMKGVVGKDRREVWVKEKNKEYMDKDIKKEKAKIDKGMMSLLKKDKKRDKAFDKMKKKKK